VEISTHTPVIAIDGPSASGKGTVAVLIARQLGFHYLDSGMLYRALALAAQNNNISLDDEEALTRLATDLQFDQDRITIYDSGARDSARSEAVASGASRAATHPLVRLALLQKQRDFRRPPGLVTDGRDMGSTVFPDATLKVYLTASAVERACRRYKQLIGKGMHANLREILQDIERRDARDSKRSVAPLQKCSDTEFLDSTSLTIDQVVDKIVAHYGNLGPCLVPLN